MELLNIRINTPGRTIISKNTWQSDKEDITDDVSVFGNNKLMVSLPPLDEVVLRREFFILFDLPAMELIDFILLLIIGTFTQSFCFIWDRIGVTGTSRVPKKQYREFFHIYKYEDLAKEKKRKNN